MPRITVVSGDVVASGDLLIQTGSISLEGLPHSIHILRFTKGMEAMLHMPRGACIHNGTDIVLATFGERFRIPESSVAYIRDKNNAIAWPPAATQHSEK
jgi:hypothetical protein